MWYAIPPNSIFTIRTEFLRRFYGPRHTCYICGEGPPPDATGLLERAAWYDQHVCSTQATVDTVEWPKLEFTYPIRRRRWRKPNVKDNQQLTGQSRKRINHTRAQTNTVSLHRRKRN